MGGLDALQRVHPRAVVIRSPRRLASGPFWAIAAYCSVLRLVAACCALLSRLRTLGAVLLDEIGRCVRVRARTCAHGFVLL